MFIKFEFFFDKTQCGLFCTSFCSFQVGLQLGPNTLLNRDHLSRSTLRSYNTEINVAL